jgi:tellurite resistance protein TehA-like permease
MSGTLIAGIGLLGFGLAELAWFVRANPRRSFALQAMMFAELGVMFLVGALTQKGPARTGVTVVLGLGVVWTAIAVIRLIRREQSERGALG